VRIYVFDVYMCVYVFICLEEGRYW